MEKIISALVSESKFARTHLVRVDSNNLSRPVTDKAECGQKILSGNIWAYPEWGVDCKKCLKGAD